ncbi:MAG: hypothetical protein HZB70_03025 [Candidatus Berkelbacteria bacterium]|nr:MAG: hypothetical protein HZB70_03025 [Candidatus Berkelbacteria bacterium]QQG51723.1 MAG: hypothetical protein HY845_04165 [Candidatus Berkelbacteria bacterium]
MGRSLLIAIVLWLLAGNGSALAQTKNTPPKNEKELQALLGKKGAYNAATFTITAYQRGAYTILIDEDVPGEPGKKNARAFLGQIKASKARVVWVEDTMRGGERANVEPIDFIAKLPKETAHYRIEFDDYDNKIVIVPNVNVRGDENPVSELARVWPTYERYCNEAIAWMKQQRYQKSWFDVEFWMQDFWPKGKKIRS